MPKSKKYTQPAKKMDKFKSQSLIEKLQSEFQSNQSYVNLVLGLIIILVVGILLFNYFNRDQGTLGPSQQTSQEQADVKPEDLPGQYTVKEGDTLFLIAEKYYQDGFKYNEIASANNLADVNTLKVGQVLEIPKLAEVAKTEEATSSADAGIGGQENQTIWGETIKSDTYTVVEGDWLSKIAGRAYGDMMAFDKIAKANNIANPDLITPGMILTIPR